MTKSPVWLIHAALFNPIRGDLRGGASLEAADDRRTPMRFLPRKYHPWPSSSAYCAGYQGQSTLNR